MGGKPRSFHFGIGFIGNAIDRLGVAAHELEDYINRNPIRAIPIMIYESYLFQHELDGTKPEISRAEFYEIYEEAGGLDSQLVVEFNEKLGASRTKHVPKAEGKPKPEPSKK